MDTIDLKEAVITTLNVLSNNKVITLILLGDDGIFCFLDDGKHNYSEARVVGLHSILKKDPSVLNAIKEIKVGELAYRQDRDSAWIISAYIE